MESKNNRYIIIRFSELMLKGKNKKEFISFLFQNIKNKIAYKGLEAKIIKEKKRILIFSENELDKIPEVLKYIVGISSYSFVYEIPSDKKIITETISNVLRFYPEKTRYRITAKLLETEIFEDKEQLIKWTAKTVKNNLNFDVDLKGYDIDINIKVESKLTTLFFGKKQTHIGLPAGSNGSALALLSGGIDSPVAAFKTITRGINTSFVTFLTPTTAVTTNINKIKQLAKKVNEYNGKSQKLFFVNFEKVQVEISKLEMKSYRIILLRRYFLRFAEILSQYNNYKFLITGDSLGQVASQTPDAMSRIDESTEKLIIRPLVSMSKNEIIKIAEEINTYETSIGPGDDMCSSFTPQSPILFPKKKVILELEAQLPNMKDILLEVLKKDTRVINIEEIN